MNWIELKDTQELVLMNQQPTEEAGKPLVIFKHSTRCSTSRMAKKAFEEDWSRDIPAYLVNVVERREVSNAVESIYKVRHESPQVLVIKNGECVYNNSHYGIDAKEVALIVDSKS